MRRAGGADRLLAGAAAGRDACHGGQPGAPGGPVQTDRRDPMSFEIPQFLPAVPELFLLGMICFILVVDVFLSDAHRLVTFWLSLATVAGTAWLTVAVAQQGSLLTFGGMFVNDAMGNVLKLCTYLSVAVVFIYSRDSLRCRGLFKGEYYILGLTALLGMMIMISAHNLLLIYLGLELNSRSLYAMVALDR